MDNELIQRWDAFLKKIHTRFEESLHHAEEACVSLMDESKDYGDTMRVFLGVESQIRNLIDQIDDTWEDKVAPQMEAATDDYDIIVDQRQKGSDLRHQLSLKLEDFTVYLEGTLSKQYYDHAIKIANQDFNCSQCGAKLSINPRVFRPQYVNCEYCETVNTFEPETKYAQIGWTVVDNIVAYELRDERKKLSAQYSAIREGKSNGEQDWAQYKADFLAYYERYFKRRIEFNVDYEDRFEDDMQRKTLELEESRR